MLKRLSPRAMAVSLVVLIIGLDQVTKRIAAAMLRGEPGHSYLGDTIRIQYAENAGAFLSLGATLPLWARTTIFSFGSALLLGYCVYSALRNEWPRIAQIGLCLIFGGGVSNLIDRIARGWVIDFMNVGLGSLRTGIFNVADMALMLGVALVLFTGHRPVDAASKTA